MISSFIIRLRLAVILVILTIIPLKCYSQQDRQKTDIFQDYTDRDKTVLLIKYFEQMHYNKGEYIGYGHKIRRGEPYKPNQVLSAAHADVLLRLDVEHIHKKFVKYGNFSWLLTALGYNVGPYTILGHGKIPKSRLLTLIENNAPKEDIRKEYLKYCHYNGNPVKSIYIRRITEFELLYPH